MVVDAAAEADQIGRLQAWRAARDGAAEVTIWGSGSPMREFLHVDDMAAACVHVLELPTEVYRAHTQPMLSHVNVGTGVDLTICELAEQAARATGFRGEIHWDARKPDGTPKKQLDVRRLAALGWKARIALAEGLASTVADFAARGSERL